MAIKPERDRDRRSKLRTVLQDVMLGVGLMIIVVGLVFAFQDDSATVEDVETHVDGVVARLVCVRDGGHYCLEYVLVREAKADERACELASVGYNVGMGNLLGCQSWWREVQSGKDVDE